MGRVLGYTEQIALILSYDVLFFLDRGNLMKNFLKTVAFILSLSTQVHAIDKSKLILWLHDLASADKKSNVSQSYAIVLPPLLKALAESCSYFGPQETLTLRSHNPLLGVMRKMISDGSVPSDILNNFGLTFFSTDELKSLVSTDFQKLNEFLSEAGFDIRLTDPCDPRAIGAVAILDVLDTWVARGRRTKPIQYEHNNYPAFKLTGAGIKISSVDKHRNPLVTLVTEKGDVVYITVPNKPYKGFELLHYITDLINRKNRLINGYDGVIMPEVKLEEGNDISYLKGTSLFTRNSQYFIDQALQQTKFAMNKHGFRAKSAVALTLSLVAPYFEKRKKNYYKVDQPFVIAIVRNGMQIPYFAGYITPDFWQEAGDLNDL